MEKAYQWTPGSPAALSDGRPPRPLWFPEERAPITAGEARKRTTWASNPPHKVVGSKYLE